MEEYNNVSLNIEQIIADFERINKYRIKRLSKSLLKKNFLA